MGNIVLYALIAIVIAAALVGLLVVGLPDERLARAIPDVVPMGLPLDREVGADDLNRMRLPVTVRGYRMVDADAVFDRLSAEIERRDREIAELRMAAALTSYRPPGDPAPPTGRASDPPPQTGRAADQPASADSVPGTDVQPDGHSHE